MHTLLSQITLHSTLKIQRKCTLSVQPLAYYMLGLIQSDASIWLHKGQINIVIKSTKRELIDLFIQTFEKYLDKMYVVETEETSPLGIKSRQTKVLGYVRKHSPQRHLFEFLLKYKDELPPFEDEEQLIAFLAGLFDGDGSIVIAKKRKRHSDYFAILIRWHSINRAKLIDILNEIHRFGYSASVIRNGISGSMKQKYAIFMHQRDKASLIKFIEKLLKYVRHRKRKARLEIALEVLKIIAQQSVKKPDVQRKLSELWKKYRNIKT